MSKQSSKVKLLGTLRVAELARLAQVTPATVRYYSRVGLLSPGREPENGYRCFSGADLRRIRFIRQAQVLGLTIGDIRTILERVDQGDAPCDEVRSLVKQRRGQIRQRIAAMRGDEERITQALEFWSITADEEPERGGYCPLIERLAAIDHHAVLVSGQHQPIPLQHDSRHYAANHGPAQCAPG